MRYYLILLSIFLLFSGCGVVMDSTRLSGKWQLTDVNFYTTNSTLDTTNTYYGTDSATPGSKEPVFGEFFDDNTAQKTYVMEFREDNSFSVTASGVEFLNSEKGEWYLNQYDNSLTVYVASNNTAVGFWKSGFKIVNYWAMPDYNTLELTIKASDVGDRYFDVALLSGKNIRVVTMKGIFTKQ